MRTGIILMIMALFWGNRFFAIPENGRHTVYPGRYDPTGCPGEMQGSPFDADTVPPPGASKRKYPPVDAMTMPPLLTNRLIFYSNTRNILHLLQSRAPAGGASPPQFSLESIRPMPEELRMPRFDAITGLLALNIEVPPLSEKIRRIALAQWFADPPEKGDEATIRKEMEKTGARLTDTAEKELFDQAAANYEKYGFFNQYDWRMARWGTPADIQAVDASTFTGSTRQIVFFTMWTPPLYALAALAEALPSVRFELKYRYEEDDPWTTEEIFPARPWGY